MAGQGSGEGPRMEFGRLKQALRPHLRTRWPGIDAEDLNKPILRMKKQRWEDTTVVCTPLCLPPPAP